ncbi:MAG: hypothetical protein FJ299_07585 [Planctomycetes bacterium]|nr:hypothetical protein [Planctomycetota bacterium]
MPRSNSLPVFVFTACACSTFSLHAQGSPFQTPGMPLVKQPVAGQGDGKADGQSAGQSTRFSSEFNPAISFALDGLLTHADFDGDEDGFELELRSGEIGINAWVDPRAWAYGIVVFAEDEVALEEGAVHFTGLGGHRVLRAGRFFVDFGKQMQAHEHELRTIERPAVLREYLGAELAGDGVQFDDWHSLGDETVLRYSIGVFHSLLGEVEEEAGSPFAVDSELKELDELGYTARLTAFTEVGDAGTLQLGASARLIPDFGFELDNGASAEGLDNSVLGLDLTYGWADETNTRRFTAGLEWLFDAGDNGAAVNDSGTPLDPSDDTIDTFDETVNGYYGYVDYAWNQQQSAGIQHSWLELPEPGEPTLSELDVYYTHNLSEFGRLRLGLTFVDAESGADGMIAALQYTNVIGAHGHGVNF